MTDLQRNTDHQCQCAQCRASRALDVLRALPSLPDDGRAALDTIEAALNELEESGFARWEAMNDVATAAGLNWMDATQQDIVDAIKQARARVAELEAALAAQGWRPVTEKPERTGCYYLCATVDDMAPMQVVWYTPDGTWYVLPDERVLTNWQPLPPAPQETTP